jgi:hypothetical protein
MPAPRRDLLNAILPQERQSARPRVTIDSSRYLNRYSNFLRNIAYPQRQKSR